MQPLIWLALSYNAPAEPSRSRVYIWRKLKEFGAEYFHTGVAILPGSPANMVHFRALAAKIKSMGGEAVIAELKFCDRNDENEIIRRFENHAEKEYREFMRDSRGLSTLPPPQRDEQLKKLGKRYSKLKSRDFFKAGDNISQGLIDLADDMERVATGLGRQLRHLLDI